MRCDVLPPPKRLRSTTRPLFQSTMPPAHVLVTRGHHFGSGPKHSHQKPHQKKSNALPVAGKSDSEDTGGLYRKGVCAPVCRWHARPPILVFRASGGCFGVRKRTSRYAAAARIFLRERSAALLSVPVETAPRGLTVGPFGKFLVFSEWQMLASALRRAASASAARCRSRPRRAWCVSWSVSRELHLIRLFGLSELLLEH